MARLYDVLRTLCDEKGITAYKMCKDNGMQPSVMTDLKMGRRSSLRAETASRVADYFGVSVNHLLGNKSPDDEYIKVDKKSVDLLSRYRKLSADNQQKLLEMAEFFLQQQDKE